jgi:hypothetical protein
MPLRALHRQVAAIALRAAAGHGFALGGGNALIQHGVISRPTQDGRPVHPARKPAYQQPPEQ